MQALALRAAAESDLPFLLDLRLATMAPHFERQGMAVAQDTHRLRVAFRLDAARIVERDGLPIGLLKLLRDDRAWTLSQIQLAPAFQAAGIGTALLRQVIAEARAAGATLHLGVLKQNPARKLYERLGFQIAGESAISYDMVLADLVSGMNPDDPDA